MEICDTISEYVSESSVDSSDSSAIPESSSSHSLDPDVSNVSSIQNSAPCTSLSSLPPTTSTTTTSTTTVNEIEHHHHDVSFDKVNRRRIRNARRRKIQNARRRKIRNTRRRRILARNVRITRTITRTKHHGRRPPLIRMVHRRRLNRRRRPRRHFKRVGSPCHRSRRRSKRIRPSKRVRRLGRIRLPCRLHDRPPDESFHRQRTTATNNGNE